MLLCYIIFSNLANAKPNNKDKPNIIHAHENGKNNLSRGSYFTAMKKGIKKKEKKGRFHTKGSQKWNFFCLALALALALRFQY